jgi:SAM-dependent methyltransferase
MRDIKNFLRQYGKLYRLAHNNYHCIRRILEMYIFGTRLQELIWKTRHLYKGKRWSREYIGSTNHPHREQIINAISSFAPLVSMLEIGCNSGPNLMLLAQRFPDAIIYGVDINKQAIRTGKKMLEAQNIKNIELFTCKADALDWVADKSMDVVFTDAVLMFIGTDKIRKIITEMGRIFRKALVCNEYHSVSPPKGNYDGGTWVHDYQCLIKTCIPSLKNIEIVRSTFSGGDWDKYGALIKVYL